MINMTGIQTEKQKIQAKPSHWRADLVEIPKAYEISS